MKAWLKWFFRLVALLLALVALGLLVLTVAEYKPAETEKMAVSGTGSAEFSPGDSLSVVTWNTGYGALGDNADFFMDGGSMVQTADRSRVEANLAAMVQEINALQPDLLFLQEVDVGSDRSYRIDERAYFERNLTGCASSFAYNFNALYVPYPMPPIGHVESGILTFSRASAASAERVQLPCPFSWPIRLVNLKRCLLVSRIPLQGTDKELVAVNLHLEAYDDGAGKAAQTAMLSAFLQAEADKGNYVIAGGDFNQLFSNADASAYPVYPDRWQPGLVDASAFGEGFSLLMDSTNPTCRSLDQPLAGADRERFQYYVIDGFIISANVRLEQMETLDCGFAATDHNPVLMRVTLAE